MKRVTIPKPVKVVNRDEKGLPVTGDLSLNQLLKDMVWPLPYWRNGTTDRLRIAIRLAEQFEATQEPGATTDLSKMDHECVVEAAMLKESTLGGPNVIPILTLLCALTEAQDVKEE